VSKNRFFRVQFLVFSFPLDLASGICSNDLVVFWSGERIGLDLVNEAEYIRQMKLNTFVKRS
jgi:hypothetical protein